MSGNLFRALRKNKRRTTRVSDSRYVTEAISKRWLDRWVTRQFRQADGVRENADLWVELRELMAAHFVTTQWIRGHAGHPENERCDQLATAARMSGALTIDTGFERGSWPGVGASLFA
ncbi:MAG TPA: RNase H family protein [Opitutaceae bacterium]